MRCESIAAARSRPPRGVPGRDAKATYQRDAGADPSKAGSLRPARLLRVRAKWHRQPVHAVRPGERLTTGEGPRPPYRRGLCRSSRPWLIRISPRHDGLCWCRTISVPISRHHFTRLSPPPRLAAWSSGSKWRYTPRHGSWLDMAEPKISVLSRQCLDRRIPDKQPLIGEVAAWRASRNKRHIKADWQFTAADARVKLKRLYQQYERLGILAQLRLPRQKPQSSPDAYGSIRASPTNPTTRADHETLQVAAAGATVSVHPQSDCQRFLSSLRPRHRSQVSYRAQPKHSSPGQRSPA
jgi:hypothetical protein